MLQNEHHATNLARPNGMSIIKCLSNQKRKTGGEEWNEQICRWEAAAEPLSFAGDRRLKGGDPIQGVEADAIGD